MLFEKFVVSYMYVTSIYLSLAHSVIAFWLLLEEFSNLKQEGKAVKHLNIK